MRITPISPAHAALIEQQAEIRRRLLAAQGHAANTKASLEQYGGWEARQRHKEAVQATLEIIAELQTVNVKLKTLNVAIDHIETDERRKMIREARRGFIDEFDHRNQLHEPQDLLRRTAIALERATARLGRTDAERAILDAAHSYLRQHGIQI